MRVVHVPFGYYPDAVGGTEVYVSELVRGLRARGVESVVAAPASTLGADRYDYAGTPVHRFTVSPAAGVEDLYGEGDQVAAASIGEILHDARADVLHLHAFTRAASLRASRVARRQGVAVAFTYHTPTASCVRGTLLHDGHEPCDGALIAQRCTACLLESRGVPLAAREALSRTPSAFGSAVGATGATGRLATALRARELTVARHDVFRSLLQECDAIVAVSDWVRSLLVRAGAPPGRLTLSRQGTPARIVAPRARRDGGDLRIAFVGRMHPTKGAHVLIDAIVADPALPVSLDVFGIAQDAEGERYRASLVEAVGGDARIRFHAPLAGDRVVDTLADYDFTAVPSQWLETGPLTVLESFAAGVPVLGSNLGGIAELVGHDRDGLLVPHAAVDAWTTVLQRVAGDRTLGTRLRAGVARPRSSDDVARDMVAVYESIAPRASRIPSYAAHEVVA
ncbi:MAG TPA: glycosyltransferase [Gemmatimonadaceae bacterium]|nr:glycosyltransferase [Gemmatimonadaceae bacterium]